ncbi:MAG: adenosylmethionine--8-amino-7-oxononanoate transaminase [Proteobacteria bacterium]|nr:adenosylmethionine--8-amino-7-oxononanoate transaminase [Pseudomonadota bacterium]MBU1743045.1 adenosylmethionine--8-amino-7-oxononanoate transaminase [Pseudomonadota bacterium]
MGADKAHLWHPFTPMRQWAAEDQLLIVRGEGNYLYDARGRSYLDGVSSLWVTVHGHNHPVINAAIKDQVDQVAHTTLLGLASPPAALLAKALAGLAPAGLTRVFYSDAGATGVEIALKMAFQFWAQSGRPGKKNFAGLRHAYHGDTLGAVSVGGMDLFHEKFRPLLFEVTRLSAPYCYRCPLGLTYPDCSLACAEQGAKIIRQRADDLAALIIEPMVMGAAGMIAFPDGYLSLIRQACMDADVLFIADCVAVGFGRTGRMFAGEIEGVEPDLMCLGKGLSGGYLPLAATLATDRVFEAFLGEIDQEKTFFHGHTFTGNPVACAAALASLDLFERDQVIDSLPPKIERLAKALSLLRDHPGVGDVRQRGLMVGIELVADQKTKAGFPPGDRIGHRVILAARRRGVILRPLGDVIVLMPPLSITVEELDTLVKVTTEALEEVIG